MKKMIIVFVAAIMAMTTFARPHHHGGGHHRPAPILYVDPGYHHHHHHHHGHAWHGSDWVGFGVGLIAGSVTGYVASQNERDTVRETVVVNNTTYHNYSNVSYVDPQQGYTQVTYVDPQPVKYVQTTTTYTTEPVYEQVWVDGHYEVVAHDCYGTPIRRWVPGYFKTIRVR